MMDEDTQKYIKQEYTNIYERNYKEEMDVHVMAQVLNQAMNNVTRDVYTQVRYTPLVSNRVIRQYRNEM